MPKELTEILSQTNPWQILLIILSLFIVCKWFYTQGIELINAYKKKQKEYHLSESAKEKNQVDMENRFKKIEDNQNKDYHRIKDLELHIFEIQEQNNKQNEMLRELSNSVRDMQIEITRSEILDAVPKCIDLTHSNIGSEDYTHLFQVYTRYEKILSENQLENSQCDLAMRMIRESYRKRLAAELLTDYRYLPPKEIKAKIRKAEDAISWWTEDTDN